MILVADASVAIKWYVAEVRRDHALALLDGRDEVSAPEFISIELANIVWKKSMRGEVGSEMAAAVLDDLPRTFGAMIRTNDILQRASDLALALSHPVYDCLYIACAELVGGGLVTDDARLLNVVRETQWAGRLFPLSDVLPVGTTGLKARDETIAQTVSLQGRLREVRRNVRRQRTDQDAESVTFHQVDEHSAGFSSIPYKALESYVSGLTEFERIDLLALSWFGYEADSDPWPIHLKRAETSALSRPLLTDSRYFMSTLVRLSAGYERYLADQA